MEGRCVAGRTRSGERSSTRARGPSRLPDARRPEAAVSVLRAAQARVGRVSAHRRGWRLGRHPRGRAAHARRDGCARPAAAPPPRHLRRSAGRGRGGSVVTLRRDRRGGGEGISGTPRDRARRRRRPGDAPGARRTGRDPRRSDPRDTRALSLGNAGSRGALRARQRRGLHRGGRRPGRSHLGVARRRRRPLYADSELPRRHAFDRAQPDLDRAAGHDARRNRARDAS